MSKWINVTHYQATIVAALTWYAESMQAMADELPRIEHLNIAFAECATKARQCIDAVGFDGAGSIYVVGDA